MEIINKELPDNCYYPEKTIKKSIVLHSIQSFTGPTYIKFLQNQAGKNALTYVIDREGKIYSLFNPNFWSYHLGINHSPSLMDKNSISIGLLNWGPLKKIKNHEIEIYGFNLGVKFMGITQDGASDKIVKLSKPFKGYDIYASFNKPQLQSLEDLLKKLIKDFNITIQDDINTIFEYNPKISETLIPGIWTHSSVNDLVNEVPPQPELISLLESLQKENTEKIPKKGTSKNA